ncbi:hypothetical protein BIW11_01030, partial [Tropilaelaps mercedesae]
METGGDAMEVDELTCTETAVDDQSIDGGSSCEEDHGSSSKGNGVHSEHSHNRHQHVGHQSQLQRPKLSQRDGETKCRLQSDLGGQRDVGSRDGVTNGQVVIQNSQRWREADVSEEMREESSLEEEVDDVEEGMGNGDAAAAAHNGTVQNDSEPRHLPGEYQFQLLPIHVQQRGDSRTGMFKVFKCDICAMVYRHVFSLKRHFLRCHINYKYLTTTDITNCGIHLQVIQAAQNNTARNGDHLYRCHVCNQLFPQREQLREHMETHTTGKDKRAANGVSCSKCNSAFADRKSLLRHQQMAHGASQSNNGNGSVAHNLQSGHTATIAASALSGAAASKKPLTCRHCGKSFIGNADLRRHERLHEAVDTTCRVCNRKFSQTEWVAHKTNTHPDANHICSYCDMLLPDVGALGQHLFQAHNKTYSENMRQINNKENGNGIVQQVQHGGSVQVKEEHAAAGGGELESKPDRSIDTTVSCELCNKSFTSLVNLQRHNTVVHIKQVDKRSPQEQKARTIHNQRSPSEEEFYRTLGRRISENLQYHIDGRLPGSSQTSAFEPERVETNNCMPWLVNNFPPTLDITHIVQIYANRPPLASTNGSPALHPISADLVAPESAAPPGEEQIALGACLGLNPVVKKEVKRESRTLFICQVCGRTAGSLVEMSEHKRVSHPNVVATHLELEGHTSAPPELLNQFGSNTRSTGILPQSGTSVITHNSSSIHKCTKCSRMFGQVYELHAHIVQCGQVQGASSLCSQRPASPRQIKQRKFGPVLNTKRSDDGGLSVSPLNGGDY